MGLKKSLNSNLNREIDHNYLPQDIFSFTSFLIGSLMVITGGTFGLIFSFQFNLLAVFVGFITFVSGYRICQKSFHNKVSNNLIMPSSNILTDKSKIFELSFFLVGGLIFSRGFVELGTAIKILSFESALLSGLLIISGYSLAHIGVNKSVI